MPYRSISRSQATNSSTDEVVTLARLVDRQPATAHGLDQGRLAFHRPPLAGGGQLRHRTERICPIAVRWRASEIRLHRRFPLSVPCGPCRDDRRGYLEN